MPHELLGVNCLKVHLQSRTADNVVSALLVVQASTAIPLLYIGMKYHLAIRQRCHTMHRLFALCYLHKYHISAQQNCQAVSWILLWAHIMATTSRFTSVAV